MGIFRLKRNVRLFSDSEEDGSKLSTSDKVAGIAGAGVTSAIMIKMADSIADEEQSIIEKYKANGNLDSFSKELADFYERGDVKMVKSWQGAGQTVNKNHVIDSKLTSVLGEEGTKKLKGRLKVLSIPLGIGLVSAIIAYRNRKKKEKSDDEFNSYHGKEYYDRSNYKGNTGNYYDTH